ncbi:MAG: hypothetical protein WC815_24255, partial [Vicinamibacterales bacterium]
MTNNYYSFEKLEDRGKYAREISWSLGENTLRWKAFPSIKKSEIFIRPTDPPEENLRTVSRISLQTKDGKINLGVSGYDPHRAIDISNVLKR